MDVLARDLRYALRSWRRHPGAIGTAIAALALGIAANTTIFSVVFGVLLRPLPYDHPERLVMVWQDMRARGGPAREWASPGIVNDWRARATGLGQIGAVRGWQPNLTGLEEPERLRGAAVSQGYFAALGVPAALGRTFTVDDDTPGGPAIAILSHDLWHRRFNRDPSVVGRTISLDGQPTVMVGVMPASFRPPIIDDAEIWSPLRIPADAPRGMIVLRVLARLAPDVTVAQAQAGMTAVAVQIGEDDPEWRDARVALVPLHEDMIGEVRPVLLVLIGAVALVLLIACANVTSLLLARASQRAREMTIRTALGADRGRIVRQLLAESLLLATIGGVVGVLLAWWGVRALVAMAPASAPRLQEVGLDAVVLVFAIAVTLLTAVLAGLAPAIAASRVELAPALRDGRRESPSGGRLRAAMVVFEVSVAMVLVVGAALLIRSLVALQEVDLGYRTSGLMTASIAPPRASYRGGTEVRQLFSQLLERASAIPGVEAAAMTSILPLGGMDSDFSFEIGGRPQPATPADEPIAWFRVVSSQYFSAIGMRIANGRGFTPEDRTDAPAVVVINETLARRYWPGASPIGQQVRVEGQTASIVGIVADSHHRGPSTAPEAEMYLPYLQFHAREAWLVLRTHGQPSAVVAPLRQVVRELDPALPLAMVAPMTQLADRSVAQPRFLATLLTTFSALATLLALVGIYGVLSFSVSRRTREIGVRMALGAERRSVLRLVLSQSLLLVGIGIVVGSALAVALSRLLSSFLFEVRPGDPATIAGMAALIAITALAASYAPAQRASRVDPLEALRED